MNIRLISLLFFYLISNLNAQDALLNKQDIPTKKCVGCSLQTGEIVTIGGLLDSSLYFEARQDCFIPIPGFIIINSKRHVQNIDDFSQEERTDFIEFLYKIRKKMRERLSIQTIYIVQEENDAHFHVWLFPRYQWMEQFGKKVSSTVTIMEWAKLNLTTPENLKEVHECAEKLK